MLSEVSTAVTLGEKVSDQEALKGASGELVMFCFSFWVLVVRRVLSV